MRHKYGLDFKMFGYQLPWDSVVNPCRSALLHYITWIREI